MSRTLTRRKAQPELDQNKLGDTREEAAKLLRISTRTLDNWTKLEGGPPYVQFQRRKFFPRAQLERWIAENLQ